MIIILSTAAMAMPVTAPGADVLIIMDESGSMAGEQAWVSGSGGMLDLLDQSLIAAGVTNNRYGVVGFGYGSYGSEVPFKHELNGSDWGVAADVAANLNPSFQTHGLYEDGFWALGFALNNYTFRPDAALNIILITDEDRDNRSSYIYASVLTMLEEHNAILNVIVNNPFGQALGTDGEYSYIGDGIGGYLSSLGFTIGNGEGNTENTYVPMALATGGAAWNLNYLRAGGVTAESFTNAFVDIKVAEIERQQTPEPGTLALMGLGILGLLTIMFVRTKM